ncbi:MAG: hypothetical protein KA354_01825 [Phycisphaerae bacterium]|nr:hypothetical protein [Phycisphaerae bacterium]
MATTKKVKRAASRKAVAARSAGKKGPAKGKVTARGKSKPGPRAKKTAGRAAKAAPAKRGSRLSWLDGASHRPLIDRYARQLRSFLEAVADGVIEERELAAQEERLVKLMKEVEPRLNDALHAKVTELLCELTAYDIMQMMHAMCENRPKSVFQG